jgi:hypothetical protein
MIEERLSEHGRIMAADEKGRNWAVKSADPAKARALSFVTAS